MKRRNPIAIPARTKSGSGRHRPKKGKGSYRRKWSDQ